MKSPTAVLYARFSPRPNADECQSCDKQLADLRAYCERHGIKIRGAFRDDAVSGSVQASEDERPGLSAAIKALKRGDILLVRSYDRLSRDREVSADLVVNVARRGAKMRSLEQGNVLNDDPLTDFVAHMLFGFAELQRSLIRQRTKAGMRRNMAAGRNQSSVAPYGWRIGGERLVEVEAEQRAINWICELSRSGASAAEIADRLGTSSAPCRGKRWHETTVRRILKRAREGRNPS